ncbi:hypothetical protein SNEBB_004918 [Seison nebaliae]|nr:hypothetical protein SNEBB_004918 [Seison nebaliae]
MCALHIPKAPGYASMMKDGASYASGVQETVVRSIEMCRSLGVCLKSAFGPKGLSKIIINHIGKSNITSDANTILNNMEVQHPAAKLIVTAALSQQEEIGDGTNLVVILASRFLEQAKTLIEQGIPLPDIMEGYEMARDLCLDSILPSLVSETIDVAYQPNAALLKSVIQTAVMSKQYGLDEFISNLVMESCSLVSQRITNANKQIVEDDEKEIKPRFVFNVDNIRILKMCGASINDSKVINGIVFNRVVESDIRHVVNGKIAVYSCPFDSNTTETKGTVHLTSAKELYDFSQGEEAELEQMIKKLSEDEVKMVVSGGKVGEMALHFLNKYKIMVLRLLSKFDVRRLARTVGATVLPTFTLPTSEEMGHVNEVYTEMIGEQPIVIFKQPEGESTIASIILRGATEAFMDDVERAINSGINNYRALSKDGRILVGAAATEMELSRQLLKESERMPGLEGYAVAKYGEAFEIVARTLAETSGLIKPNELVARLIALHDDEKKNVCFSLKSDTFVDEADQLNLYDSFLVKMWAIKNATNVALTILSIDQIIMAKQAGGPKVRPDAARDD